MQPYGRTYSNSCLIVDDSGGGARRGGEGGQCHQYARALWQLDPALPVSVIGIAKNTD